MSTMKDVAKRAGVSIATVSHIINGTKTLTPKTQQRVMQAIEELDYVPDQTAKSFKTGRKNVIAFIVPDISNNYFANIIDALEEELRRSGYHLILTNTKESVDCEIRQLRYLTSGVADGIVLASAAQSYDEISPYIPEQFPVVLIDRKFEDCPLDMVNVSDTTAITSGMTRLIRDGHTRIGYIGDLLHLSTSRERLQTYLNVMEEFHIPVGQDLIKNTVSLSHAAYALTGELLGEGCTAIVVGNNVMTVDAYSYLFKNRERYPDVQILGYHHRDMARLFSPKDGIIMLNEDDMGISAGRQILNRIKDPKAPQKEIVICDRYVTDPLY